MSEYITHPENKLDLPKIELEVTNIITTPVTDSYEAKITSENKQVGRVIYHINKKGKEIIIQNIQLSTKGEGIGTSTYLKISLMYPEYNLISSSEIRQKDNPEQEKPNAIYLWEKLVRLGFAEGDEQNGFKMKK